MHAVAPCIPETLLWMMFPGDEHRLQIAHSLACAPRQLSAAPQRPSLSGHSSCCIVLGLLMKPRTCLILLPFNSVISNQHHSCCFPAAHPGAGCPVLQALPLLLHASCSLQPV